MLDLFLLHSVAHKEEVQLIDQCFETFGFSMGLL